MNSTAPHTKTSPLNLNHAVLRSIKRFRISYEESKVYANVTKEAIQDAVEYHMPRAEYRDTRE